MTNPFGPRMVNSHWYGVWVIRKLTLALIQTVLKINMRSELAMANTPIMCLGGKAIPCNEPWMQTAMLHAPLLSLKLQPLPTNVRSNRLSMNQLMDVSLTCEENIHATQFLTSIGLSTLPGNNPITR
jgi:hypothetical protein